MQISEQIIQKLKLQLSNDTIGASFMTGSKIYIWPKASTSIETVYLLECDLMGNPMKERIKIMAKAHRTFRWADMEPSLVLQVTEGKLIHMVNKTLDKCPRVAHGYNQPRKKGT